MQISQQRLYFTGVLALGVHVVVLLGFNSSSQQPAAVSTPLSIALQRAGDDQTHNGSKPAADAPMSKEIPSTQQFSVPQNAPNENQTAEAVASAKHGPTPVSPEPKERRTSTLDRRSLINRSFALTNKLRKDSAITAHAT